MNNTQSVIAEIRHMNQDQLSQVVEAIKLQRTWLARTTARALAVGDSVSFTGRNGVTHVGTVKKVNQKTVIVNEGFTNWKVPASMLKMVDTA
jgi:uncharacterized protein YkvS